MRKSILFILLFLTISSFFACSKTNTITSASFWRVAKWSVDGQLNTQITSMTFRKNGSFSMDGGSNGNVYGGTGRWQFNSDKTKLGYWINLGSLSPPWKYYDILEFQSDCIQLKGTFDGKMEEIILER